MNKKLLILLLLFNAICFYSQQQAIDSVKLLIPNQKGIDLLKSYHKLTLEYVRLDDYNNASYYNRKALKGLESTPDSTLTIFTNNYKGIIALKTRKLDSAIIAFTAIIDYIGDNSNLIKHTIGAYGNRSLCYDQKDLSHKALDDLIQALETAKKYNEKKYVGILYGSVAMNFHAQQEYSKAVEYHLKAIETKEELNNQHSLAISYQNIALSYSKLKDYNLAFEYFEKGRKIFVDVTDKVGIALSNHYTGLTYHELYKNKFSSNNENSIAKPEVLLDSALKLNKRALKQLKDVEDEFYTTEVEIELVEMLISSNKIKEANKLLDELNDKLENTYDSRESRIALQNYKVNKLLNKFNKALDWHERYATIEDSLNNKQVLKEIGKKQAELSYIKEQELSELKHQNEINQINRLNEKNEIIEQNNQKKRIYVIVIILLAIFISSLFLVIVFRRWRITKSQKDTINLQKQLIEKEKLATEDSINYAKTIQDAAFTSQSVFNELFKEHFIYFNPKDIVSGDFYWATQIGDKKIIAFADCTGHGVPGAFMTLISLNILNQIVAEKITSPTKILEELHIRLRNKLNQSSENTSKHGLDIALCTIDENEIEFAGTHNSLYLIRNSELIEYKGDKFQLGSKKETTFKSTIIKHNLSDIFYIFTDGFPDQKGGIKNKKYFYPNLRKFLLSISKMDLNKQHQEIDDEFNKWKGRNEQFDDVSIIGFKVNY